MGRLVSGHRAALGWVSWPASIMLKLFHLSVGNSVTDTLENSGPEIEMVQYVLPQNVKLDRGK